ncbi:MAG: anti-sigma factor family protein [Bacteroidota bacterium]
MECREFQDHVTAAVDNRLSEETKSGFLAHAGKCPQCRGEYESESLTKSIVRSRLGMVRTPEAVRARVANLLLAQNQGQAYRVREWVRSLQESVYFKPAVAFAAACIAVVILLSPQDTSSPIQQASLLSGNVIQQSFANYRAVVDRRIQPEVTEFEKMAGYFSGKTTFPVLVPKMKRCSLIGGILNDYEGLKLAHVVYKHDNEVVYLYQACWKEVQKGERISLPEEAKQELRRTGRYSTALDDGYSIVLWTDGRTLCSAVAHMPENDLIACVSDDGGNPSQPK